MAAKAKPGTDIYQQRAVLRGVSPLVWRRLPVRADSSVGATQDLLALNIDLGSVMQAGRWKSTAMPMRYGEEVLAARGGMARAAEKQGRDNPGT